MWNRTATVFACGVLLSGAASAQVSTPNPTQGATAGAGEQVPLFRVTVVGRTTSAINYRPRRGDTKVDFAGTTLMPAATGYATVSGEKGYIKVDAHFDKGVLHLTIKKPAKATKVTKTINVKTGAPPSVDANKPAAPNKAA